MAKRIVFLILLVLIIGLSACGNNAEQPKDLEPDGGNSVLIESHAQEETDVAVESEEDLSRWGCGDDFSPALRFKTFEYIFESNQEYASFIDLFESNPIDRFYKEKAERFALVNTIDVAQLEAIYAAAWGAEMDNCYELLKNLTENEHVRGLLDDEKRSYLEYLENQIELRILFETSNAFNGDDEHLYLGSIHRIFRVSAQTEGHRAKARELLSELYVRGVTPQFVFLEEKYDEVLREVFSDRLWWDEVFGNENS